MNYDLVYVRKALAAGTVHSTLARTDLSRRVWKHKNQRAPGITSDDGAHILVWSEAYDRVLDTRC